jgi:hypothetical protein
VHVFEDKILKVVPGGPAVDFTDHNDKEHDNTTVKNIFVHYFIELIDPALGEAEEVPEDKKEV